MYFNILRFVIITVIFECCIVYGQWKSCDPTMENDLTIKIRDIYLAATETSALIQNAISCEIQMGVFDNIKVVAELGTNERCTLLFYQDPRRSNLRQFKSFTCQPSGSSNNLVRDSSQSSSVVDLLLPVQPQQKLSVNKG